MNSNMESNDSNIFTLAYADLLSSNNSKSSNSEWVSSIENSSKSNFWKYEEDKTLKEVLEYIQSTYNSHYTSKDSNTQVIDLIESIGDAEAFSRSSAIKYLSRFGRKNGKSKLDLLKAIHFCVLLYHYSGLHSNKTDEYKTF